MITVHHLENSRSFRILWALEEAGLDYGIDIFERDPVTRLAPERAKELHPMGKFPMLSAGDRVLAESGAILEWIADQVPEKALRPAEPGAALDQYRYWLHAAEGSLMPILVSKYLWRQTCARAPFFIRPVAKLLAGKVDQAYLGPAARSMMGQVEAHLGENDWFAGDGFTFADVQMAYPLEAAASRMDGVGGLPNLARYLERIRARPGFKAAREKGGDLIPAS